MENQVLNIVTDAWDYKGRPAVRSKTGGWTCAAMILVVEIFERMATLGIAVNLIPYLTQTMHLGNAEAANNVTNFLGTSFMLCLFGGFIADTFLGRYLTIAIFTAVQASGVTILTISTAARGLRPPSCDGEQCAKASGTQMAILHLGLYLTALGTGGLKSSVSGLGSDQFDDHGDDDREKKQMVKFFNWFFFLINIGSLFAVTVLVYIQDNVGRPWGYGICAVAILIGLVVFLSGTPRYRFKKLAGSPLTQIAAVVVAAWRKRKLEMPGELTELYEANKSGFDGEDGKHVKVRLMHTDDFSCLDKAAIVTVDPKTGTPSKWRLATVTDVEEVKQVVRMLPVWATTILFWTVYAQMTTFSVSQATTMDRRLTDSFVIPAGSLTVFFIAAILLTVPIYERIVVPLARPFTRNPKGLSSLQQIAVGLVLSILGMVAAALTERKRLHTITKGQLSVFWLVPQFLLVGSGEAFTYGGQLDFFLRECPRGMKTISTGLFLSTLALGFFISSTLVSIVHAITGSSGKGAWLPDNLNKGKLYNFYWLLGVLSVVNLAAYLVVARRYVYKETRVGDESVDCVEMAEEATCHV